MAKLTKFQRSQKAHSRLCDFYFNKGNTDKNRALGNYHSDIYDRQFRTNKIVSKKERKKIFSWWWNYEHQK